MSTGTNGIFRSRLEAQADVNLRRVEKTAADARADRALGSAHRRESRGSIEAVAAAANDLRDACGRLNRVNPDLAREVQDLVRDLSDQDGAEPASPDAMVDRIRRKAYSVRFFAHRRGDLLFRATENPEALDAIRDASQAMHKLSSSYECLAKLNPELAKAARIVVNAFLTRKDAGPISADAVLAGIRGKMRDMRSSGARGGAGAERD